MPYPAVVRTRWALVAMVTVAACSSPSSPPPSLAAGGATPLSPPPSLAAGGGTTTVAPAAPTTAVASVPVGIGLPNPRLTPGATDPRVTQANIGRTICLSGYTATVRPPVSVTERIKVQAMAAYGLSDSLSNYELDHLIPLELGGAPADIRNLWPEPYDSRGARPAAAGTGAERKDLVENAGRRAVCDGRVTLAAAQEGIAANWVAFGRSLGAF